LLTKSLLNARSLAFGAQRGGRNLLLVYFLRKSGGLVNPSQLEGFGGLNFRIVRYSQIVAKSEGLTGVSGAKSEGLTGVS